MGGLLTLPRYICYNNILRKIGKEGERMKEAFSDIVGNDGLRRRLGDDLANGTLAHAYILSGPHGSGKHTIARILNAEI